jgi:hypothetical protein
MSFLEEGSGEWGRELRERRKLRESCGAEGEKLLSNC